MPCRALDAFGRIYFDRIEDSRGFGLNALSGIGCIRTCLPAGWLAGWLVVLMPCRALDAFGRRRGGLRPAPPEGLNALSGIGCIRTSARCDGEMAWR